MGFYGIPSRVEKQIPNMTVPLLLLAAGADFTPPAVVADFAEQVRANGTEVRMEVFEDMPHSFFDRTYGDHADACDRAWREMLSFVDAHSQ
jgi:carboxymethylenebutenolidase